MELILRNTQHYLQSLVDPGEFSVSSLDLLGYPIIVRNLKIVVSMFKIDSVYVPDYASSITALIQANFPAIDVKEFSDSHDSGGNISTLWDQYHTGNAMIHIRGKDGKFELPLNSLLYYNSRDREGNLIGAKSNSCNCSQMYVDTLVYPWEFLDAVRRVMAMEITDTVISSGASVAKSSIITGPCIIEDDVTIDDFCKIVGPCHIGRGSTIGMGSLIRESMLGINTRVGFNCEIGRTYFKGQDKIAHQNVILDSLIGRNVWFGGYTGTSNNSLSRENITYRIGDRLVDTGRRRFGAVIGNNCAVGASVIVESGNEVKANTVIQAGTIKAK